MVIPKRSSMQKTAPQTKAETQLFLKDNDEISRESGEKVPKDPFKFALRDPSIRNEHKQKNYYIIYGRNKSFQIKTENRKHDYKQASLSSGSSVRSR
mmetsp:Transcript_68181/g.101306  ORF Transcript_68181/g.101306 Transcript_68181/m.101306 type:complete len:97 (-) Transcript_68181:628-918(-)